jgi:hypothetical protein
VASKIYAPAIYIKYKNYEFIVYPEIIERVEAYKFYGKEDKLPYEHLRNLHDLSCLYGKSKSNNAITS